MKIASYLESGNAFSEEAIIKHLQEANVPEKASQIIARILPSLLNKAPVTSNVEIRTPVKVTATGNITASDPDGDELTYLLKDPPQHGNAAIHRNNGMFTYTPNPNFTGDL